MTENYNDYLSNQRKLLQSLFSEQKMIPKVCSMITEDDISDDNYKIIFNALNSLYDTKSEEKITLGNIYEWALDQNLTINAEVLTEINNITTESPNTLAKIIKRQSGIRQTQLLLQSSLSSLSQDTSEAINIISQTESEISNIIEKMTKDDSKEEFRDIVANFFDEITKSEAEEVDVVPLFYKSLEPILRGGWKAQQLITVGGRTGNGKTVVAINSAIAALNANRSVLFFSLEMAKEELLTRMMSVQSDVIMNKLEAGRDKTVAEMDRIRAATEIMKEWKLNIDDNADITLEEIKAKSKLQAQTKEGLDMIIIDYLQLITPSGSSARLPRQEQVAELSREIKKLAKRLEVPVMILVQLNRENKSEDENYVPSKADIRESAAIAADSDVVLIVHRKYRDDDTDPKALFIIDKNRGGQADRRFKMRCVLEKSMFKDIEPDDFNQDTTDDNISIDEPIITQLIQDNDSNDSLSWLDDTGTDGWLM